jgi:hypothetical protein
VRSSRCLHGPDGLAGARWEYTRAADSTHLLVNPCPATTCIPLKQAPLNRFVFMMQGETSRQQRKSVDVFHPHHASVESAP